MAEKDPHVIGARIARRRHQLDWSQVELARRLDVSPSTVANWERGASYPKKKLGKVEQVLGISLDGEPQPEPESAAFKRLLDVITNADYLTDKEKVAVIAAIDSTLAKERGGNSSPASQASPERHRPASL